MPLDKSKKVIEFLEDEALKVCPTCGNENIFDRVLGGIKNGADGPVNRSVFCRECGTNLTEEKVLMEQDIIAENMKKKSPK